MRFRAADPLSAQRWPSARVTGLDSPAEMVEQACAAQRESNLFFELADAATWTPVPDTDVLVSNAMMQWIPDHRRLMSGWLDVLALGTWFAAQMPGNFGSSSRALMRQLADSERWVQQLSGVLRHEDAVGEPVDYLRILLEAGFETDVWESNYGQVLLGPDPLLEWVRGTALRAVLDTLDAQDAALFESQYAELIAKAHPPLPDSGAQTLTLLPFRRIFMVGKNCRVPTRALATA